MGALVGLFVIVGVPIVASFSLREFDDPRVDVERPSNTPRHSQGLTRWLSRLASRRLSASCSRSLSLFNKRREPARSSVARIIPGIGLEFLVRVILKERTSNIVVLEWPPLSA